MECYLLLKVAANTFLLLGCIVTYAHYAAKEDEIGGVVFLVSLLALVQMCFDANTDIQGATIHDRINFVFLTSVYYLANLSSLLFFYRARKRRLQAQSHGAKEEGSLLNIVEEDAE